jgi:hypothetical protein
MEKRWSDKYVFVTETLDRKAYSVFRFYSALRAYYNPFGSRLPLPDFADGSRFHVDSCRRVITCFRQNKRCNVMDVRLVEEVYARFAKNISLLQGAFWF